ncbi:CKLF-like MARVEL transmembrane domain-containing protein 6 [Polypterus senegalus]|uniref:CKLF-like MARVEL transmembrane domain-containing protein 6 n=1 Tax=Polypterus senegalus TaxID=55291 RepID=UPI00196501BA|nr:CKLF-like MARVEL transmembrane domain-containing protein 6 [Polypterus senegalus]XP_039592535.1 CKLF-like MARVEL transmembrane domain-containing protein 6 [Polypterus senegalus]
MADAPVYNKTTTANPHNSSSAKFLDVPNDHLDVTRAAIKVVEVVLSFVAFICEEVIQTCVSCGALYFFEFVSCTVFLFCLLLLVLLATTFHKKVGITCWRQIDFFFTLLAAVFFLIASIVFAANNEGSELEKTAIAFGFLSAFVFLIDFGLIMRKGNPLKKSQETPDGTTNQDGTEKEPMNTTENENV